MTDQPQPDSLLKSLLDDKGEAVIVPAAPEDESDDVDVLIDALERLFTEAKRVPFGKKLMVDEEEALSIVDRLRTAVPNEVKQAHRVLDEQEQILSAAQAEAREMLTDRGLSAQLEIEREQIVAEAEAEAARIRAEADKYVHTVLRDLSEHLAKAQTSVQKGLETLDAA